MERQTKHRFLVAVAAVIAAALLAIPAATQQPAEKYNLAVPMIEGFEQTKFIEMIQQMGVALGKKMGCDIKSQPLVFKYGQRLIDLVRSGVKAGKIDISYINGLEHGEALIAGETDLTPVFILGMQKSTVEKACFFVRKGEFKEISELRGKKFKASHPLLSRAILYKNGIDEPLDKFFGSVGYATDSPLNPMMEGLANKSIDVFGTYLHTVWLAGELTKKDSIVQALGCEDVESHWVFVARKDMPEQRKAQLIKAATTAHKDKEFAQFQFAFTMINGHFMPVDEKAIKINKEYASMVKKGGWRKEEAEFFKKYHPGYKGK